MRNHIRTLTLHDLCLQVVAKNLEKFIYSREVPQDHIDFLLGLYSDEVFRVFKVFHGFNEEAVLWFLNPQCKNVTLPIVSERIIQQLQVVGPVITSLKLNTALATEDMLKSIMYCIPNVTELNLSKAICSDETLLCVKELCCSLITLNLHGCQQITDNGMKHLSNSVLQLRNLNLIGTSVTDKGLSEILKEISSLQCLKHYKLADSLYYIHKSNLEFKTNVNYNLTELIYNEGLSTCKPIDVLQAWITTCPKITKCHITIKSTREILEICSKFEHLTELKIIKICYFEALIFRIKKILAPFECSLLTSLTLHYQKINIVTLLQSCKDLQILRLRCVSFAKHEEIKLEENKLKELSIEAFFKKTHVNYKAICLLLSVSKSVTTLTLNQHDYDRECEDSGLEILDVVLKSMQNLSSVDLRAYDIFHIDNHYLSRFFEIPSLKIIHSMDNSGFARGVFGTDMDISYRYYPESTLAWQECYYDYEFVVPGFPDLAENERQDCLSPSACCGPSYSDDEKSSSSEISSRRSNLRNNSFRVFQFFHRCCRNPCPRINRRRR